MCSHLGLAEFQHPPVLLRQYGALWGHAEDPGPIACGFYPLWQLANTFAQLGLLAILGTEDLRESTRAVEEIQGEGEVCSAAGGGASSTPDAC